MAISVLISAVHSDPEIDGNQYLLISSQQSRIEAVITAIQAAPPELCEEGFIVQFPNY